MDETRLQLRDGPETLNGPIVEGYSCLVRGPDGDVLVTCANRELAQGIAAYLDDRGGSDPTHVLIAQPPWYKNNTQGHDLGNMLGDQDQVRHYIRLNFPGVKPRRILE